MTEIALTLCSDYLPNAYLKVSTLNYVLPSKLWIYFIQNTTGEPNDAFSEIWIYQSKQSYDNDDEHAVLQDISIGLSSNGVRDGNLLMFKTKNEAA